MILHLLKLVWNRRRSNLLLMTEIFLAFVVVFAVSAAGLFLLHRKNMPMGFEIDNVWFVSAYGPEARDREAWKETESKVYQRLVNEVRQLPEVRHAAMAAIRPYTNNSSVTGFYRNGGDHYSHLARVSDEFIDVMNLELLEGRWFEPSDSALEWNPIVINERLADELFGEGVSPLGERLREPDPEDEGEDDKERPEDRIVGVIREYRYHGEYSDPKNFHFRRSDENDPAFGMSNVAVKLDPGTTAAYEEVLQARLESVAPGWEFRIHSLPLAKKDYAKMTLLPVMMASIVAGFLLLMVVLGLTGVLWQNVTRRTRELGLRRALGARRSQIHKQIVVEVMLTASFGLLLGIVVALQVPLIGPFAFLPMSVVIPAMVISAIAMATIAGICGLYPGWSATRIGPSDALHYE